MEITWDDIKEQANIRKHGVSFEEAVSVIYNPLSLFASNAHPKGDRYEYLGYSDQNRVLYVVTVEETDDVVRIISARKAESHEREAYEKGI